MWEGIGGCACVCGRAHARHRTTSSTRHTRLRLDSDRAYLIRSLDIWLCKNTCQPGIMAYIAPMLRNIKIIPTMFDLSRRGRIRLKRKGMPLGGDEDGAWGERDMC